jgi:hypothetical protein
MFHLFILENGVFQENINVETFWLLIIADNKISRKTWYSYNNFV